MYVRQPKRMTWTSMADVAIRAGQLNLADTLLNGRRANPYELFFLLLGIIITGVSIPFLKPRNSSVKPCPVLWTDGVLFDVA